MKSAPDADFRGAVLKNCSVRVEQARGALLKQREQDDRYGGREDDPQVPRQICDSRVHRRPLPAHLPVNTTVWA